MQQGHLFLYLTTRSLEFHILTAYTTLPHTDPGAKFSPLSPHLTMNHSDLTPQINEFDDVNLPPDEQTLLARIPLMAGSSKKAAYLAFRATGFTIGKACDLAGTTRQSIQNWRNSDPVFRMWEQEKLHELQSHVGYDVIKFDFLRNMKLLLHQDMTIIAKAMMGLDELSQREWEQYKNVRKMYTPNDWLALEKILAPEKHRDTGPIHITLNWGNRQSEDTIRDVDYPKEALVANKTIDSTFEPLEDTNL